MKFSSLNNGQVGLILALSFSVLVSSCNQDEFFPTEEMIEGADAYCAEAKDLNSCQQLVDICQPAYEPEALEGEEPVFSQCVANPDLWVNPPADNGEVIVDDGTDGSGGSTDPVDETGDPTVPVDESVPAPTLEEAYAAKCSNLDAQYLWTKKFVKKGKVINKVSKVKICHMANASSHTIVVACPALKAHINHDDYLGACSL